MRSRSWWIAAVLTASCVDAEDPQPAALTAELPLHLEDHLASARIEGSELPEGLPDAVEWRFDEPRPDWSPVEPLPPEFEAVASAPVDDALRLSLSGANRHPGTGRLLGSLRLRLRDWTLEEWSFVEIQARTSSRMRYVGLDFNYTEEEAHDVLPFFTSGDRVRLVTDGTVQTYRLSLDSPRTNRWKGPWTDLGIWFNSEDDETAAALDLLTVRVIPAAAQFGQERLGTRSVGKRAPDDPVVQPHRRTLFLHAPGRITYRVRVPDRGRLDVGLGVLPESPVTFSVTVETEDGERERLLEETYADHVRWGQRSIDLSHLAGETLDLTLGVTAKHTGAVALWGVPTLSGARATDAPNVIFYVIDGGGADYMSVYGYHRPTTPHLERIAALGAVFERAHSNASWTRPSTASFLTSLQHTALGGLDASGYNLVPDEVLTMAQRMRRGGYQTAQLTSNPNAGRVNGLERGIDFFREAGVDPSSVSSVELHRNFRDWRALYPAEPYWVHFQTTDVHNDHYPVAPFAGRFIDAARRETADRWRERVEEIPETPEVGVIEAIEQLGLDREAYWTAPWDLHDETMLHQDQRLGELVAELEAKGEWERTLLIVAGDHSVAAGAWDYCLLTRDPQPPHVYHDDRATPMLRPGVSRVPLIFVWPGRIAPGQRFEQAVSMLDVLPTLLDLLDLPLTGPMQGQSLAPLLLGEEGWQARPVVLDESETDRETGELGGRIEVIDGRWGASLEINPRADDPPRRRRTAPLLLFDLEQDPLCLQSLHEERADLVEEYTRFLRARWEEHRELSRSFTRSGDTTLTSEQLEALEALGDVGDD